jgi:hypothetical protein
MTRIYEIPYQPDDGSFWTVRLGGVPVGRFPSRFEALRAAVNLAAADGAGATIAVEGADGIWRPFGSDAKRPVSGQAMPPMRKLAAVR